MEKLDVRKQFKAVYSAKTEPTIIDIPKFKALAIEGAGDPSTGGGHFPEAVSALYSLAYTLKFSMKKERGLDWAVMPLEGDWYCDNMEDFSMNRKENWKWKLYIVQPDFVEKIDVENARAQAFKKKELADLRDIQLVTLKAHKAAHIMHLGPYASEPATIQKLHAFIQGSGFSLTGFHREIYLGDPAKTAPEKLKTIIRQPFK